MCILPFLRTDGLLVLLLSKKIALEENFRKLHLLYARKVYCNMGSARMIRYFGVSMSNHLSRKRASYHNMMKRASYHSMMKRTSYHTMMKRASYHNMIKRTSCHNMAMNNYHLYASSIPTLVLQHTYVV